MTEMKFYKVLGERCKARRKELNLNTAQVSRRMGGFNRALIGRFENEGKKISAYRLNQLLGVLELQSIEDVVPSEKKTPSTSTYPCQPVTA